MKVYSDSLTRDDMRPTPPGTYLIDAQMPNVRLRARGWNVRLCSRWTNRHANSGKYGAATWADDRPASWDQYGAWIADLYAIDPDAVIGPYRGRDDFHAKTDGLYMTPSEAMAS